MFEDGEDPFAVSKQPTGRPPAPTGPIIGYSDADRNSAAMLNDFAANPQAAFTQSMQGMTLRARRRGAEVSGSIGKGPVSLSFTGVLRRVDGRRALRIEGLRFSHPVASVRSAPSAITVFNDRNGIIRVSTDRPFRVSFLGFAAVNEPVLNTPLNPVRPR